jgi:Zn-dependent protease
MAASASDLQFPCPDCGIPLVQSILSCPGCGRLTRSAELEQLAQRARAATTAGDFPAAIEAWTRALELLPPDTVQYRSIQVRIDELRGLMVSGQPGRQGFWQKGAGAGSAVLLLLTKGKALLLGLTKLSTLVSMFGFFGVYWALYGWAFALGLVLSIYVHEMGHVMALRHFGIPATAPMFIPGFGAFIRVRAVSMDPVQDSRVGLAGPLYGLGAAVFCLAVHLATGAKAWGAVAHAGAVMNLFNLIPVWQLDGSRGLHSLTRGQRGTLLVIALAIFAIASERWMLIIAMGLGYRLFTKDAAPQPDNTGFMQFAILLAALTTVIAIAQVY